LRLSKRSTNERKRKERKDIAKVMGKASPFDRGGFREEIKERA